MKTQEQIIEDQQALSKQRDLNKDGVISKEEDKLYLLKLASQLLAFLRNETLSVEESNPKDYDNALKSIEKAIIAIPKTDKVAVTNLNDYNSKLDAVLLAIKQIKIPEVKIPEPLKPVDNTKDLKSIEKAVKDIKIPEVKIPEPKEVDFSVLIKEVKALKNALEVGRVGNEIKTQNVLSDVLSKLESGLKNIELSLKKLDKEPVIQKDRTNEVLTGLKEVSQTINDIKFPVATFNAEGIIDAINNMEITADSINLNTDGIEALITSTNSKLDTLNTTGSSSQSLWSSFEQKSLAVTQTSGSVSFTQKIDSAHIQNTGSNACYINFDATATTSHYKLMPGDSFPAPVQFTALHAICDTGLTTTLRLIGYF